jgi:hypothetical protein
MSTRPEALAQLYVLVACASVIAAASAAETDSNKPVSSPPVAPDLRKDEHQLKFQKGDLVVVPVPISNPTLDTGLVVGGAYFYPQTAEQKAAQPASVTAVAGMYTSNDSKMFGIGQQNYWNQDTWRFGAVAGYADLRLSLLTPVDPANEPPASWDIRGGFAYARISRKVGGNWFVGLSGRLVSFAQSISTTVIPPDLEISADSRSVGVGLIAENDSRDMPMNSYDGRLFEASALFNDQSLGSDTTYQSYKLGYSSYHELARPLVLAWQIEGCLRSGTTPLWDACRINLRGFPATDYLGKTSASAQLEARWRMSKRWGMVGFAGGGYVGSSFSGIRENELIPSYGIGLRFTVLPVKRINLRLDYARSIGSDAIHVSVGEAF